MVPPPSVEPVVFVSHTTHDKRDFELAHGLAAGLRERGAEVWIAPDSIPAGADWNKEIVSGVMEKCTHFLVIISAASVAASAVLREISLARERQERDREFVVLALAVGDVPEFPGKPFLDRRQRVSYHSGLTAQLEAVASALRLPTRPPRQFESLIKEWTKDFVGRQFVFDAIARFLQEQPRGYIIIEGDPGMGKTAVLAEYARRTGCVAHFNVAREGIIGPTQFLDGVCKQICSTYGLAYNSLPAEKENRGSFFRQFLQEASQRLPEGGKLVLVVDALDEVDPTGHPVGANILYLPGMLPDGVYVLLSKRRTEIPFVSDSPMRLLNLLDYADQNLDDARSYIRAATARPELLSWIDGHNLSVDSFVETLTRRSENNFMYLHYVLPDIEYGLYADIDIDKLPLGLEAYYDDHWRRMGMTTHPLRASKIKLVYILCEVRLPVSARLLQSITKEDALAVQDVLKEWDQFFHKDRVENETRYSLYHTSFRDFLHRKDVLEAARVTMKDINRIIADSLWQDFYPD